MARGRTDAIIAGVNKAGTTSLFVSLSTHPDVAPSSIKETRYFLPARYGQPLEPRGGVGRVLRRRRRPAGAPRGDAVVLLRRRGGRRGDARAASSNPRVLVVLREPVSRAALVLHLPEDPAALPRRLPDRATTSPRPTARRRPTSATPRTRSTWRSAVVATPTSCRRGSTCFGTDTAARHRLRSELVADPVDHAARDSRRGSGSTPAASPPMRSARRTAPPGSRTRRSSASRSRATTGSSACCAGIPDVKRKLRAFYYRLNGRPAGGARSPTRCAPSSRRATRSRTRGWLEQLDDAGIATPRLARAFHRPSVPASPKANSRGHLDAGSDDRRERDEHERALEHQRPSPPGSPRRSR